MFSVVMFMISLSLLIIHVVSVPNLRKDTFDAFIASEPFAIILFYTPWCSVSKEFLPVFEAASIDMAMAKVDCVEEESLSEQYEISSFPTVLAFIYGQPIEYSESFDKEGFTSYINRIDSSGAHSLDDHGGLQSFLDKNLTPSKPVIICSSANTSMLINFEYVCMHSNVVTCAVSTEDIYDDIPFPSIFIQRQFHDEDSVIFASDDILNDAVRLKEWFYNYAFPQIIEFSAENEELIFSPYRPGYSIHILVVGRASDATTSSLVSNLRRLYSKYHNKCVFIMIDTFNPSEYISNILTDIQISRSTPTTLMAVRTVQTKVEFFVSETVPAPFNEIVLLDTWISNIITGVTVASRSINVA